MPTPGEAVRALVRSSHRSPQQDRSPNNGVGQVERGRPIYLCIPASIERLDLVLQFIHEPGKLRHELFDILCPSGLAIRSLRFSYESGEIHLPPLSSVAGKRRKRKQKFAALT